MSPFFSGESFFFLVSFTTDAFGADFSLVGLSKELSVSVRTPDPL